MAEQWETEIPWLHPSRRREVVVVVMALFLPAVRYVIYCVVYDVTLFHDNLN